MMLNKAKETHGNDAEEGKEEKTAILANDSSARNKLHLHIIRLVYVRQVLLPRTSVH